MWRTILLLGLIFIYHPFFLMAQNDKENDFEEVEVIVFEEDSLKKYMRSSNNVGDRNALKIAPLNILIGEIPLFYERHLGGNFSAEVGLGLTLSNFVGDLDALISNLEETNNNIETELQTSFRLGIRYYIDYPMEEYYFAPEFAIRNYASRIFHRDGNENLTSNYSRETTKITEYRLIFGHQGFDFWANDLFFDYYFGAGIRQKAIEEVIENNEYNNFTGKYEYSYDIQKINKISPALLIGVKIGFVF